MDIITVAVVFCFALAALFLGLWLFYDRRDYAFFEHARRKGSYLCSRCDNLYAAPGNPGSCPCPRCGHENHRLRF